MLSDNGGYFVSAPMFDASLLVVAYTYVHIDYNPHVTEIINRKVW